MIKYSERILKKERKIMLLSDCTLFTYVLQKSLENKFIIELNDTSGRYYFVCLLLTPPPSGKMSK